MPVSISSAGGTLGLCLQNSGGRVIVDAVDPISPNSAVVRDPHCLMLAIDA